MKTIKNIFIMLSIFCLMMSGSFAISHKVIFEENMNSELVRSNNYRDIEDKMLEIELVDFNEKYGDKYNVIPVVKTKDVIYYEAKTKEEYDRYVIRQKKSKKEELDDDIRHEKSIKKSRAIRSVDYCEEYFDWDNYYFNIGDILLKRYENDPKWLPSHPLAGYYHHAGLLVNTNKPGKKAIIIEAGGSCASSSYCDEEDEIEIVKLENSEFAMQGTKNLENNECNPVKKIRVLDVPDASFSEVIKSINYAKSQDDKRYGITSKWDEDEFYCSKLVWKAYDEGADINIDDDLGYFVTPSDIYEDSDTNKKKTFYVD